MTTPCPNCRGTRRASQYLCRSCWFALPPAAQRLLNRRDKHALARLQALYDQIHAGRPLGSIEVPE